MLAEVPASDQAALQAVLLDVKTMFFKISSF